MSQPVAIGRTNHHLRVERFRGRAHPYNACAVVYREMENSVKAKPFLRWAGGKRWMLRHLENWLPSQGFGSYHEPFLGGGAVFFDLSPSSGAYLSDLNGALIETYVQVRDDVETVIELLEAYQNTAECYYATREQDPAHASARAARFIFLNQTSFNGIYRVNLKGEYNVPYGNRTKDFLDAENLRLVSKSLAGHSLEQADFDVVRGRVRSGDFVFIDPPYTVSHNDNGFVRYNQKLFSLEDQRRLSELVAYLNEVGAHYVLTNAAHETIAKLFDPGSRRIKLERVSRVGGKKAARGRFHEYVFTNVVSM